jgi:hypothetical protein
MTNMDVFRKVFGEYMEPTVFKEERSGIRFELVSSSPRWRAEFTTVLLRSTVTRGIGAAGGE